MKRYIKHFLVTDDGLKDLDRTIDNTLKNRKATAEDIVSITTYNPGIFRTYAIWYKSEKK